MITIHFPIELKNQIEGKNWDRIPRYKKFQYINDCVVRLRFNITSYPGERKYYYKRLQEVILYKKYYESLDNENCN